MVQKLSIIIPHYNSQKSLKRLLDSITLQNLIQIIVVDDKSEWKTGEWDELIAEYQHIEFYKNDTDVKGAGTCRNIGLSHAVGEWLLFADADDYFSDGFYKIVSEYFESEYDIVYFMPTSVYEETGEPATRHYFFARLIENYIALPNHKNELLLRYEYEGPCSRLIRRSIVEKNEILFETVRYSNDVMFSMKTANHAKRIAADRQLIYVITKSTKSLTATINPDSAKTRLDVFIRKMKYLKNVLSQEDFSILNINGLGWLLYIWNNRLGRDMFFYCVRLFQANNIPLLNYKLFTISYWLEKRENQKRLEKMF